MADIRQYRCPHCAYCTEASGAEDRGIDLYIKTVVCLECRELHDVPARRFDMPEHDDKLRPDPHEKPLLGAWARFKVGEMSRASGKTNPAQCAHLRHYWKDVPLTCPEGRFHRVEEWLGMNLPFEEELEAGHEPQKNVKQGGCPKCGTQMLRSQSLATWE